MLSPPESPAGGVRTPLTVALERLRLDPNTQVHAIGQAENPDALAASLTEDQIQSLTEEQGGGFRVVSNPEIRF